MDLLRPLGIAQTDAPPLGAEESPDAAAKRLLAGERLLLASNYGVGVSTLAALRALLRPPGPKAPFATREAFERRYRQLAEGLLAPIVGHELALPGAGPIGFLKELYPESPDFFLPLVHAQELHSSWATYRDGVQLAVLGRRLRPFYGTYAPTRTEHLELFATWLSSYEGRRESAIDVGTGCGVLSFLLARRGFTSIAATDSNPNAVESVRREVERHPAPIAPIHGDLLCGLPPADLIVFNPPWMRGDAESLVDQALYYREGLFQRFFDQAVDGLAPGGRIVLLFSTIHTLVQPEIPHPIEAELERGRLKLATKLQRKVKPGAGHRRTREKVEVWELVSGR